MLPVIVRPYILVKITSPSPYVFPSEIFRRRQKETFALRVDFSSLFLDRRINPSSYSDNLHIFPFFSLSFTTLILPPHCNIAIICRISLKRILCLSARIAAIIKSSSRRWTCCGILESLIVVVGGVSVGVSADDEDGVAEDADDFEDVDDVEGVVVFDVEDVGVDGNAAGFAGGISAP